MGLEIFERGNLPRWLQVQQRLDTSEIRDIPAAVAESLRAVGAEKYIRPGMRVAIGGGSRGIDRIAEVIAATVAEVKRLGAEPFIVPSMGSHGGATAEGQKELLAHYGITEATVGAPIYSSMDTVNLGEVEEGVPVFFDKIAATQADVVIPINRVKPHTDFHGPVESGLMKMIAIGFGKQKGADTFHAQGFHTFHRLIPAVATHTLAHINIPFGIALVENGLGRLGVIEAVLGPAMYAREQELIQIAREKMPRLPGEKIDVLVIDEIGKDISGIGADTNVINRYYDGPMEFKPVIERIIIRGLTEETGGNATGIGLGDVALRRAWEQMDPVQTYINVITAKKPEGGRIPLIVENDRQALYVAIACCLKTTADSARIARIRSTKHLEQMWLSEPLWNELAGANHLEALTDPEPIQFTADGMFLA